MLRWIASYWEVETDGNAKPARAVRDYAELFRVGLRSESVGVTFGGVGQSTGNER